MIASLILFAGVGIAVSAPAQEKTRAQVRQELIEAQHNGLNFITDTSYPVVAPIFEQQVNRLKQQNNDSGMGAAMTGASDTGRAKRQAPPSDPPACVGPVSFCNIYSGS
ncbi:DUF4148 domain-containing protein [Burkholderia ubonensis]|uniref:DUF4148 domain-containing protein n=1 Tax=Burkholderia ubonensis subsp. mesacidophila TaxID=265293 RepID=A0A2A4FNL2_9BURK|nr:DUF4148 domain-containing protein [Burkholderia ubonensis]PCE33949.1 hypothetical protein BZL54_02820 [Burkholderia ubonensis subsp. mesacidophila]